MSADPLAELLHAHEWHWNLSGPSGCKCGDFQYTTENARNQPDAYAVHKADAIREALANGDLTLENLGVNS